MRDTYSEELSNANIATLWELSLVGVASTHWLAYPKQTFPIKQNLQPIQLYHIIHLFTRLFISNFISRFTTQ